jgi:hypothetical protein
MRFLFFRPFFGVKGIYTQNKKKWCPAGGLIGCNEPWTMIIVFYVHV